MNEPPEDTNPGPPRYEWPMDRTAFSIGDLEGQGKDLEYWLTLTGEQRIHALEYMRHLAYGTDWANDRIERVFEIVDMPPR